MDVVDSFDIQIVRMLVGIAIIVLEIKIFFIDQAPSINIEILDFFNKFLIEYLTFTTFPCIATIFIITDIFLPIFETECQGHIEGMRNSAIFKIDHFYRQNRCGIFRIFVFAVLQGMPE